MEHFRSAVSGSGQLARSDVITGVRFGVLLDRSHRPQAHRILVSTPGINERRINSCYGVIDGIAITLPLLSNVGGQPEVLLVITIGCSKVPPIATPLNSRFVQLAGNP